jgi:DNA-binding response OmpR family regulator
MRILVVEDEPQLASLMRAALTRAEFAIDLAPDLASTHDHLAVMQYDGLVLDLGLPDGDGLSLLRRLRAQGSAMPVLVLTARDAPEDRVIGLDAGADDYLIKPFHMPELVARVRALLRRPGATFGIVLTLGNLVLDTTTRRVQVDGAVVALSVRETTLLEHLLRHQLNVVSREVLEQSLYSFESQLGSNAIEVLVHRLRRKLADSTANLCIHTVRGVGYVLTEAK